MTASDPVRASRAYRQIALAGGSAVLAAMLGLAPAVQAAAPPVGVGSTPAAAVAAAPVPPRSFPVLARGDSGQPVRDVQYLLRAHGQSLTVDGNFGPRTQAAVLIFQDQQHLTANGMVNDATWRALLITVRRGSTGDAVRAVQSEFQFRNLSGDPSRGVQVDGVFGPRTEQAVRGFQGALGLTVDGVVGPQTWNQLITGALSG
jgi:peptidoglycan hydrolase-like protein with peptidoglycan-binding domain